MSSEKSTVLFPNLVSIVNTSHDLWEISANVNNYFGLFTIHFFTKSRLATIDENEQFSRPVPQTLKGPANTRSRISRCTVCLRKPPDRIIPFVL